MSLKGARLEREHETFYRVYYDAWVVRNINGPRRPGEWVKEVRTQDCNSVTEAYEYGKAMTADAKYAPNLDRPEGFFVTAMDIIELVVIPRDED